MKNKLNKVKEIIEHIVEYDNKNLKNSQYHQLLECVDLLEEVIKDNKIELILTLIETYGLHYSVVKKLVEKLDNSILYECVEDRQGGEFGVGRIQTELQWALTMLDWCQNDEMGLDGMSAKEKEEWFNKIFDNNNLIPFIDETWEITIKNY